MPLRGQRIMKKGAPFKVGLRRRLTTDGKEHPMDNRKYIGMEVHQASISIAVSDAAGKVLMECIIETKAATVLEFFQGLRGSLSVTFEEGTSAATGWRLLNLRDEFEPSHNTHSPRPSDISRRVFYPLTVL